MIDLAKARILVVAPHVDDEVACAGALYMAAKLKARIDVLALSSCEESVPEGATPEQLQGEFRHSCSSLGALPRLKAFPVRRFDEHRQDILEVLVENARKFKPEVVICPSSADIHQDHQVVTAQCERAFRESTIIGWEPLTIHRATRLDGYFGLSVDALEAKLVSWRCYVSQRFRAHLDDALLRGLAVVRGRQSKQASGLAEAYEVIRWV